MEKFTRYSAVVALDPDEWPGAWEEYIQKSPALRGFRRSFKENLRVVESVILGPRAASDLDVVEFCLSIVEAGIEIPNGGVVFTDPQNRIFRTNWVLTECWEWARMLEEMTESGRCLHTFTATGAAFELERIRTRNRSSVRLQHLDWEHPDGLEESRNDLPGVLLLDLDLFTKEITSMLSYLTRLHHKSSQKGLQGAFEAVFGCPPSL